MRYVCLIYFDPQKVFNQSPESNAVLAAVGPHDESLKASGHLVMAQPLTLPKEAMTVQVRDGYHAAFTAILGAEERSRVRRVTSSSTRAGGRVR